jgi:hypothetical protein
MVAVDISVGMCLIESFQERRQKAARGEIDDAIIG